MTTLASPQGAFDISKTLALLSALVVISRVVKLVRGIKAVNSLPGFRIPFAPCSVPSGLLPDSWWNPSFVFVWKWRKNRNVYRHFGRDTVSFVPFLHGTPMIFTRSLEVGRQILLGGLDAFDKSPAFEGPFQFWGPNIVDAYGDQWRKHRKISSPAFNNDTYAAVWDASYKLFADMMSAQGWASQDVIEIPSIDSVTFKFSLTIFTSVGFGVPLTWSQPPSQCEELSTQECLDIITKTLMLPVIAPSWAWKLPFEWMKRTRRAYDTMRVYMRSQVNIIRENIRSNAANGDSKPSKDLFSLLIHASEDAGGKRGLSDDELIGDVFSFLYAGHDTTAHSLAATLAFLALDFDIQDELVSQVREATEGRDDDTLLYEDYGKLDKILAAFYESIRMFPPGPIVPREAKRDTILNVSDTNEPRMLIVKKGTQVVVDLVGIHYHPRYYSDPEVYRPSRWYAKKQDQSSDVKEGAGDFTGFSFGPRSCIGRKYSSTEAVCFLAHLLRDWQVEPSFLVCPNGQVESVDEWRERIFRADVLVTLGIKDHGVRLVRRRTHLYSTTDLNRFSSRTFTDGRRRTVPALLKRGRAHAFLLERVRQLVELCWEQHETNGTANSLFPRAGVIHRFLACILELHTRFVNVLWRRVELRLPRTASAWFEPALDPQWKKMFERSALFNTRRCRGSGSAPDRYADTYLYVDIEAPLQDIFNFLQCLIPDMLVIIRIDEIDDLGEEKSTQRLPSSKWVEDHAVELCQILGEERFKNVAQASQKWGCLSQTESYGWGDDDSEVDDRDFTACDKECGYCGRCEY